MWQLVTSPRRSRGPAILPVRQDNIHPYRQNAWDDQFALVHCQIVFHDQTADLLRSIEDRADKIVTEVAVQIESQRVAVFATAEEVEEQARLAVVILDAAEEAVADAREVWERVTTSGHILDAAE